MLEEKDFDIGVHLRTIREMYGFSQRALAKRADVTNGIISMIEQNRNSPSVATLKKILGAFPLSLADFFTFGQLVQEKIVYSADELVEIGSGGFSFRQVGSNLKDKAMQVLHEKIVCPLFHLPALLHRSIQLQPGYFIGNFSVRYRGSDVPSSLIQNSVSLELLRRTP